MHKALKNILTRGLITGLGRRSSRCGSRCRSFSETAEPRVVTSLDPNTGIASVVLNRPKKLNALDLPMFQAIADTIDQLHSDTSVRVVILSGAGRGFCSGLDIQSFTKAPMETSRRLLERPNNEVANLAQQVAYGWRKLPVPVLCAIHGVCYGGGLQIAMGADIRFACSETMAMSIMETKWGLIPDMAASVTLRGLVPPDVAKELTWTGKILTAQQAATRGLVTHAVPADDEEKENKEPGAGPLQAAQALAMELVQRSPDALAAAKRLFDETQHATDREALLLETELQRSLLVQWNQVAATGRSLTGYKVPYASRKQQ